MSGIKKAAGFVLTQYRYFLLAAIVIVASCVVQDPWQNFKNVVMLQMPYILIYTFGMTIVVLTGGLDLSIGSTAALSSCLAGFVIIQGHVVLGIILGVVIGAVIGILNGLLVTKAKVPSFIATYGMDWVLRGAVYIIMGGVTIFGFSKDFRGIAEGSVAGISNLLIIAAVICVILLILFQKTRFGRNVYMLGSNMQVSKLTGMNTDMVLTLVYMISGIMAASAGLLYVARLDAAESFLGKDFGLTALAATLIGGTALTGGKGGVANSIVGVLIMVFLTNALNVLKVSVLWQDAVFGLVIILSALLEKARSNYVTKRLK